MTSANQSTYNWTRYWHPRGESPSLSSSGYLLDAGLFGGKTPGLITLDEIAEPCSVLLGPPGIGKSTELRQAFTRARSVGTTAALIDLRDVDSWGGITKISNHPPVRSWLDAESHLTLFLDSLDEGLLGVPSLASALSELLDSWPLTRLSLRLGSRGADWPDLLTEAFRRSWGDGTRYLQLAPLREKDVVTAAINSGIDSDAFLSAIDRVHAGPLAARPVTLNFLLRTFEEDGALPRSRRALYDRGCLLLATEVSQSRTAGGRRGQLQPRDRLAVAARIAFLLTFSNKSAISTADARGLSSDLPLDAATGGIETAGGVRVPVTAGAIREVLDTALFSSHGVKRFAFAHHTYGEHLAAWYAAAHRLSWPQLSGLLWTSGASDRRIAPQLHETAARIAERGRGVRERIIANDVEVLLASDLTGASATHRADIVTGLLSQVRKEGVAIDLDKRGLGFAALHHPNIAEQLRNVVNNRLESTEVRCFAIDVAQACAVSDLSDTLSIVALNLSEPLEVRVAAAGALGRIGNSTSRLRMKALALQPQAEDDYDRLRGNAFLAAWPEMSAEEVFSGLTSPRRASHFGPYELFLHRFGDALDAKSLPYALDWALIHAHDGASMASLVSQILRLSWDNIDQPGVVQRFAKVAAERLRRYEPIIDETDLVLRSGPKRQSLEMQLGADAAPRRLLADSLMALARDEKDALTLLLSRHAIVRADDVHWIIERVASGDAREVQLWSELLWRLFVRSGIDLAIFEAVCTAVDRGIGGATLRKCFAEALDPVELGSERAKRMRYEHLEALKWEQRDTHKRQGHPATLDNVKSKLDRIEEGKPELWWQLCLYISRDAEGLREHEYYLDPTARPVWSQLDAATRSRMVEAAHAYLISQSAEPEKWLASNQWWRPTVAGYRAFVLLHREAPNRLAALSADTWASWAPALVAMRGADQDPHGAPSRELVAMAYAAAPKAALATVESLIDAGDQIRLLSALECLRPCWDSRISQTLLRKVKSGKLQIQSVERLLRELLGSGDPDAEAFAAEIVRVSMRGDRVSNETVLLAARVLLSTGARAGYEVVWPIMRDDETFGRALLESLARGTDQLIPNIERTWGEAATAQVYLWLAQQFPLSEDIVPEGSFRPSPRFNIGRWRWRILSTLESLGTSAATAALESINAALPLPRHAEALRNARELARRNAWRPATPAQLLKIANRNATRLVRDGDDLLWVVIESLGRFQESLQGELPLARSLWHPVPGTKWRRPHDEGELADAIARHLKADVVKRGIVAGRELVIRRGSGEGAEGHRTDIYITAVTPGQSVEAYDSACVILEVKGSWNADVRTAMASQLVGDYLVNNQNCRHGVFVVGWYSAQSWDPADRRRSRAAKFELNSLRNELRGQARQLTRAGTVRVQSAVLDVSLGAAFKRSPTAPRSASKKPRKSAQRRKRRP